MPYFTKKGTGKDKGKTCVYKKEGGTKIGCTAGPIEKYMAALHMVESEGTEWLMGPIQIKFGDIKDNFKDFISVGDIIYLSGILQMTDIDYDEDEYLNENNSIKLDMEPVVVREPHYKGDKRLEVTFGENITSKDIWSDNIGDDWVDLGNFPSDYDLLITIPEKNNITESKEDDPLSWIRNTGGDIESFVEELRNLIQEHVPVAHLELDWDQTSGGGEYFGRVWLYDRFYELYKYDKIFKIVFYYLDPETDRYEVYSQYENLPKYRLLTILLNDMINVSRKNINESEEDEWGWARDIKPKTSYEDYSYLKNFDQEYVRNPEDIKVGDLLIKPNGHSIYRVEKIENYNISGEIDSLGNTINRDISYRVRNVITNRASVIKPYIQIGISYPSRTPRYKKVHLYKLNLINLNESEDFGDFEWAKEIDADLEPGRIYDIKTGNGYYWVPEIFVGKGWDDEYQTEFYKFKDVDGGGSGKKSVPYVKELIEKGRIRPYDPNWSIKDELTFSDNLEDALKGNFVIYFKDGVYLDQTLTIQDKLFDMGFSFYTKGPNEYITTKDSPDKIQFFESFNWDNSNPRYKSMPSDQWDQKKILLSKVNTDEWSWRRTANPRLEEQELFITVKDHNAIVINGDKYTTNNITESEEFDWIHQQEPEKKLKKSKSYVVDVSHLRPKPMRYSHDPSLTRQDILRRFKDLGYNTEDIDVDDAKYFYIEPNQGTGWQYNEYGTPIDYEYWIDYNTYYMEDPSYGGKYQMIDIDELMFLLDNNLISESDESMSWLTTSMGEPMSICEAQSELKAGDTIMINELLDYDELERQGSGKILENVTALVLDVDRCNKIQPDNRSSLMTILIHVNEDYVGFDDSWFGTFANEEHKKICLDGRCMFLICGESYGEEDIKITKLNDPFLGESKKPINEVAGISFESREWADIIYNEIISNPEEKTRLIIDGYDYPDAFNGFPIDYVVIDYYDRITGYGQEYSGYDKNGNYIVHLYVQPKLVMGQGGYTLKSALNHELKHAWEDYNRRSKGLPSIDDTKESKELYNKDFIHLMSDEKVVGPIKDILKYFYYLSKLETGPYMENVYDQNPAYESLVREIATKDFESFKDRFDLELNWHLINTNYNIPFTKKFKSATDFIDYSAKELRKRANKVIKKINKVKYVHGKL